MENTTTAPKTVAINIAANTKLEEILRIFDAQKKNLQNLKDTTLSQRLKKVKKLREVIMNKREQIQQALYADFKKPALQVDLTEIYPIIMEAKNF